MAALLLGLCAGAVSTVAGMGGGMFLVLALSVVWDARRAVALTAPAMLLANVHRTYLFRESLDTKTACAFIAGAAPGALAGSLVAVALPDGVLPWILLAVAALAVARALGWIRFEPGPRALAPAGAATGGLAAVSGAAMVGPVLMASGLRGNRFIATASASAVAVHLARLVGYGAGGLLSLRDVPDVGLIVAGLIAGNLAGRWVRERIGESGATKVSYGVLLTLVVLALAGLA